jgi:hypothetical protein
MSKSAAQRAGGATARANWHYGPCGQGRGPVQRQAAWGRGSWQGKGANPGHGGDTAPPRKPACGAPPMRLPEPGATLAPPSQRPSPRLPSGLGAQNGHKTR